MECIQCDSSCGTCIGPTANDCLNCDTDSGFLAKDTSSAGPCQLKTCSDGEYLGLNKKSNIKECLPCKPECQTCTSEYPEYCSKCKKIYLSTPLHIPGFYDCQLCESFKGLKSPATPGDPCEGIYSYKLNFRNMWRRLKYGNFTMR